MWTDPPLPMLKILLALIVQYPVVERPTGAKYS